LAMVLGYPAGDTVQPAGEEREAKPTTSEAESVAAALTASPELRRLASAYDAKGLAIQGERAKRLPQVDLVAQYALLTRYSHYDQFFNSFKRHNAQLGASFQVPLFTSGAIAAAVTQAELEQRRIRMDIDAARSRIQLAVHQAYQDLTKAEGA